MHTAGRDNGRKEEEDGHETAAQAALSGAPAAENLQREGARTEAELSELKQLLMKSSSDGLSPEEEALALRLVKNAVPASGWGRRQDTCWACRSRNPASAAEAIYDTGLCGAHVLCELLGGASGY